MIKTLKFCTVATAVIGSASASAGGLWLNEYGDFAGGRAAAGAAAGVDDAITLAYNPASISRLKGRQLFVSAGALVSQQNFDIKYTSPRNGYDDGGNAGGVLPYSSMAYVQDLEWNKWSVGIGLVPLAGASLDYSDNWAGRFQATKVDLQLLAVSPTLAYQVTDRLSLGASVQGTYSDINIHTALPRILPDRPEGNASINGDDMDVGFTLGTMYELSPRTRFGIAYQSELEPKYDGDLKLNPRGTDVSTDTKLPFAEYVRFSAHQEMNENWSVDFTVGWDNWSTLDHVLISSENRSAGLQTNWHDTYHVAWGAQYKYDNYWTFTGGVAYDTNPVSDQNRTAQLPADKQMRYAVGAQYALSTALTLGGYINYAELYNADIKAASFGGDYDYNNLTQIIANLTWKF